MKKINLIFLLLLLCGSALLSAGDAFAGFSYEEAISGNILSLGSLGFSLNSESDFSPEVTPDNKAKRTVTIKKEDGFDLRYSIKTENLDGELCGDLILKAKKNGQIKYQDLLGDFSYDAGELFSEDEWQFVAYLNDEEAEQEATSHFDIVFEAWQVNLEKGQGGFSDEQALFSTVTSGVWVDLSPFVEITYPEGGEVWYLTKTYTILWNATSEVHNDEDLEIEIWIYKWHADYVQNPSDYMYIEGEGYYKLLEKITGDDPAENTGNYDWTVPNEARFISDRLRIKITATDPDDRKGTAITEDFCPLPPDEEDFILDEVIEEETEESNEDDNLEVDNEENTEESTETTDEDTSSEEESNEDGGNAGGGSTGGGDNNNSETDNEETSTEEDGTETDDSSNEENTEESTETTDGSEESTETDNEETSTEEDGTETDDSSTEESTEESTETNDGSEESTETDNEETSTEEDGTETDDSSNEENTEESTETSDGSEESNGTTNEEDSSGGESTESSGEESSSSEDSQSSDTGNNESSEGNNSETSSESNESSSENEGGSNQGETESSSSGENNSPSIEE